jgi:hypothetical protein
VGLVLTMPPISRCWQGSVTEADLSPTQLMSEVHGPWLLGNGWTFERLRCHGNASTECRHASIRTPLGATHSNGCVGAIVRNLLCVIGRSTPFVEWFLRRRSRRLVIAEGAEESRRAPLKMFHVKHPSGAESSTKPALVT